MKGGDNMKYDKPELVILATAAEAVQGSSNKGLYTPVDSLTHASVAAYESDE
jgi:hypothetical protein